MARTLVVCMLLSIWAAIALCDNQSDMMQMVRACMQENGVTESEVKNVLTNDVNPATVKDNIKCHLKCMMEKKGHFVGGVLNEELAIKNMRELPQMKEHMNDIEKAVRACKNEKGANDCDTAFKITMCLKEFKENNS